jgi:NTP pyrophosphatase (non-canonical NTP hydrolase)
MLILKHKYGYVNAEMIEGYGLKKEGELWLICAYTLVNDCSYILGASMNEEIAQKRLDYLAEWLAKKRAWALRYHGYMGGRLRMKYTPHEAAAKIITHYGAQHQLVKLCEECGELIQQAAKCYDKGIPYSDDMIEEIADVIVMILQFEGIMSRPDSELLQKIVTEKLERQLDRIDSEGE